MAHINLHVAAGLMVGTAIAAPYLLHGMYRRHLTAKKIGVALLIIYGLGIWAALPNFISWSATTPASALPFGNVFVFHSWLDARTTQGLLIGELLIAAHVAFHYGALTYALWRSRRATKDSL